LFANKVGGGFWNGRGFLGARRVDNEVGVSKCGSDFVGLGVGVRGGFGREGENVINVNV
jgi:hypothetical protein